MLGARFTELALSASLPGATAPGLPERLCRGAARIANAITKWTLFFMPARSRRVILSDIGVSIFPLFRLGSNTGS